MIDLKLRAQHTDVAHQALRSDATFLRERSADDQRRRQQRRHQEIVAIPRLRLVGSALLLVTVAVHNALLLDSFDLRIVGTLGVLQLAHYAVSRVALQRYYREDARFDLGTVFLATDVIVFVLAIYASGGERSWLLPLLCVRVADQLGTTQRRAFKFATWTVALHAALILYLAFVEQRAFRLDAELAKVAFVYLLNVYLSLAAKPGERQRKHYARMTGLARDLIDELGNTTRQLEAQRLAAEAGSRAKGVFLANMSHEIRTPLNAVLGMTELLLEERLPSRQQEMVRTIETSGRSLLELINGVLDMSKVESGELELSIEDLDLPALLETVVSPMRVLAHAKALELHTQLEALTTPRVRGDALRLRQVLFNLVGNAIKFTEQGLVTIRVETLAQSTERAELRFSVTDTGIGMTPEASKRVFAAFQQADESTTRLYGGTGLGLSISKALVALMSGDLSVRTELGRGSCFEFRIELPIVARVAPASTHAPPIMSERLQQASNAAALPRVLIAEDTEVNRVLLQKMLERYGCEVTTVSDGAEAQRLLTREHAFDLVFMDWHMPKMDGLDATVRVRAWEVEQSQRHTPIIGFTASAFASEIERCRQAGMDDVLSKPVVRAQLEAVLNKHVGAKPVEPARAADEAKPASSPLPPPPPQGNRSSRFDPEVFGDLVQMELEQAGFLPRLLNGFIDRAPERMRSIEAALEQRDVEILERTAHSLRGSAGGFGATRLAELCGVFEKRAAAGAFDELPALLASIRDELAAVNEELASTLLQLPDKLAKKHARLV